MMHYLKCKYYADKRGISLMYDEVVITFRVTDGPKNPKLIFGDREEWPSKGEDFCIVRKDDVSNLTGDEGLVKLVELKMEEKRNRALVGIPNSAEGDVDRFYVPLEDMVTK